MKKLISLIILAVMSASIMLVSAGCGGGGGDTVIPLDVDFNNKPQLNVHLQATGDSEANLNASRSAQVLKKHTGYDVKYSQLPATETTMAVQLALINRSPYHAIKVTKQQFNILMAQDALLNIKPALDVYGNFLLDNIIDANWSIVTKDGGIYGIPEGGTFRKGQQNVVDSLIFRQDLLFDEGLDVPTTLDEFTAVLRFFKNKYGASYRPLTFPSHSDGSELAALIPSIAVAFDIYQYWSKVGDRYVYYLEHPNYKDYMEYMMGLYDEGLIDLDVMSQDKVGAISKFGQGNAVCIAGTTDDISSIVANLRNNNIIAQDDNQALAVVGGLKDSEGNVRTYHRGGFAYVTVIPRYMNEQAAYTVDWLTRKLYDDAFKDLSIGIEGEHHIANPDGSYTLIEEKRRENSFSPFFSTGTLTSGGRREIWLARIRGTDSYEHFMELNRNADEEGTYNPILFTNQLGTYDEKIDILNTYAREEAMRMMFGEDRGLSRYDSVVAQWKQDGGTAASQEITAWAAENFDGKVKVDE